MKQKPEMSQSEEDDLTKNPVNVFSCGACKDLESMKFDEFKIHLFEVHKLKPDQLNGKKQIVMHMNGSQWFSSTYEWTLESGLKFSQFIQCARSKDDIMRRED